MAKTQAAEVLAHLQSGKTITSIEAINLFGATRLSAIIFDLRQAGQNITTNMVTGKNRYGNSTQYAQYKLIP